jgi:DNA topoisomerase I
MKKYHRGQVEDDAKLEDFDFKLIKAHLDEEKAIKAERPAAEKKKEAEEREKKSNYYNFCLFNGEVEKVANTIVEPPGIFRGRGEHPSAGLLKTRIVPEWVQINIGQDDPIPACTIAGHSWKRVTENKDATWLAGFKDERSNFAAHKYVFLAAESKLKGENDKKKYEKARRLKGCIDKVRLSYEKAMETNDAVCN